MPQLFKNIRRKLAAQNRAMAYMRYAIGEILLVVIGILIALQVNNWNESRKNKKTEHQILNEILIDLGFAKRDLKNIVKNEETSLRLAEKFKSKMLHKAPIFDSVTENLTILARGYQFTPQTSGYQNLKSVGLDIIRNDSLRKSITALYDVWFDIALKKGTNYNRLENPAVDLYPFLRKYYRIDTTKKIHIKSPTVNYYHTTSGLKIGNYNELLHDEDFLIVLQKSVFDRAEKIIFYKKLIKEIDRTSTLIKKSLPKRE
jgi:hypothetical protein